MRSRGADSKYPFTGGAEAGVGTSDGALIASVVDNSGVYEGGRAGKLGRTGLVVCLWVAL